MIFSGLNITFSKDKINPNINIENSYKISKKSDIKDFVCNLRKTTEYKNFEKDTGYNRTLNSQVDEWCGHNFLYKLNYKKNSTASVDLDQNESTKRKICYFILSLFYFLVS